MSQCEHYTLYKEVIYYEGELADATIRRSSVFKD